MSRPIYTPNALVKAYYSWRSLSLPWRRRAFRGFDLEGNTYWESYNPLTPAKKRRTVAYVRDGHYTDNAVTPQWMSWLRHTRVKAPTREELVQEVQRIQSTRTNAKALEMKWVAERERLAALTAPAATAGGDAAAQAAGEAGVHNGGQASMRSGGQAEGEATHATKIQGVTQAQVQNPKLPPAAADDGRLPPPGTRDEKGEWQPEAWQPGGVRPRR